MGGNHGRVVRLTRWGRFRLMEAEGELRQLEREDMEASPMDRARAVRDFMGGWRARDRGPVQCAGGR